MLEHDELLALLAKRFDYYSARVIAKDAIARAGLTPQSPYDDAAVARLVDVLGGVADRMEGVIDALKARLATAAPAPAAAPVDLPVEAAPEPLEAPAPVAAEPETAAPEAAPAEEPKDEPKEEKKSDKKGKKK